MTISQVTATVVALDIIVKQVVGDLSGGNILSPNTKNLLSQLSQRSGELVEGVKNIEAPQPSVTIIQGGKKSA